MVGKGAISCKSDYCATEFYLAALWVRKITVDARGQNNTLNFPLSYKFGDVSLFLTSNSAR